MRKYKSAYLKPYIRRLRKTDKEMDFRTAVRLAAAETMGYKYVLVQRGVSGVLDVDKSKQKIKNKLIGVKKSKDFDVWANQVKKKCQER